MAACGNGGGEIVTSTQRAAVATRSPSSTCTAVVRWATPVQFGPKVTDEDPAAPRSGARRARPRRAHARPRRRQAQAALDGASAALGEAVLDLFDDGPRTRDEVVAAIEEQAEGPLPASPLIGDTTRAAPARGRARRGARRRGAVARRRRAGPARRARRHGRRAGDGRAPRLVRLLQERGYVGTRRGDEGGAAVREACPCSPRSRIADRSRASGAQPIDLQRTSISPRGPTWC